MFDETEDLVLRNGRHKHEGLRCPDFGGQAAESAPVGVVVETTGPLFGEDRPPGEEIAPARPHVRSKLSRECEFSLIETSAEVRDRAELRHDRAVHSPPAVDSIAHVSPRQAFAGLEQKLIAVLSAPAQPVIEYDDFHIA